MADNRVISYTDKFGGRTLTEHAAASPSFLGDLTLPAPGVALGVTINAIVNTGRWLAVCPTCQGAEYVNLDNPLFFCCECRNQAVDHQPIPVTVPDTKTRSQIETYLGARPAPANRNWLPGETVKDLRAENRTHGIRLA